MSLTFDTEMRILLSVVSLGASTHGIFLEDALLGTQKVGFHDQFSGHPRNLAFSVIGLSATTQQKEESI